MIAALGMSIAQLGDPRFVRVFLLSIALTLALLVVAWLALDWLFGRIGMLPLPAFVAGGWAVVSDWAALPVVIIAGWFLFPGIATGVMSLFLDSVVDAVEDRHYPTAAGIRAAGFGEALMMGLASALRLLLWNLALSPLYLILLFTAIGPLLLFVAVNGWLLGRDLLEMVAIRHMPRADAARFVAANRTARLALGATAAALFLIPFGNLAAPLVSAALATHAFHRARQL